MIITIKDSINNHDYHVQFMYNVINPPDPKKIREAIFNHPKLNSPRDFDFKAMLKEVLDSLHYQYSFVDFPVIDI